jgi:hypothetical protein
MDGKRKVRLSDYPLLAYYGKRCRNITPREAAALDFEGRFNAIGRYVVGQAIKFWTEVLSGEGRVGYDPEDIFLELRIDLQIRNVGYDAAKGTYLTFARRVISNRLSELLERTHVVKLPANASEKYKELIELEKKGPLKNAQKARLASLVIANADHEELSWNNSANCEGPADAAEANERRNLIEAAISDAIISSFSLNESLAVGCTYGLWKSTPVKLVDAERNLGLNPGTLRRALASAKKKLRERCSTFQ